MSLLIWNLFKQAPEVLGQVGIKAYVTGSSSKSFGKKSYLGPEHQNDKLCSYLTVVLMTDGNNHAMLGKSFEGDWAGNQDVLFVVSQQLPESFNLESLKCKLFWKKRLLLFWFSVWVLAVFANKCSLLREGNFFSVEESVLLCFNWNRLQGLCCWLIGPYQCLFPCEAAKFQVFMF